MLGSVAKAVCECETLATGQGGPPPHSTRVRGQRRFPPETSATKVQRACDDRVGRTVLHVQRVLHVTAKHDPGQSAQSRVVRNARSRANTHGSLHAQEL